LHAKRARRSPSPRLHQVKLTHLFMVLKMLPALGMACPPKCRCEKLLFYCDSQGFHSVPNTTEKGSLGLRKNFVHVAACREPCFIPYREQVLAALPSGPGRPRAAPAPRLVPADPTVCAGKPGSRRSGDRFPRRHQQRRS
uniref:Uncharacterized protein n=1 Tax=Anser brachyrhynchus TaxID=132585 RepID=A0A8B9CV14_9AVES